MESLQHVRYRLLISTVSVLALALLAGSAKSASAVPAAQQLPLTWFNSMVVDPVHNHVFITGRQDNVIAVRNADGSDAGTITGQTNAGGMVLDGSNLYVARCDGSDTIDVIDTATLTKVDSISASVDSCFIAEAGGRLWYGSGTAPSMVLTSVPLDGSTAEKPTSVAVNNPTFATTPVHPDWLVFGDLGSTGDVSVYDVSDSSAPSELGSSTALGGGQNLDQLAITSDGGTLLMSDGSLHGIPAFSLPDLTTAQGSYALTGTGVRPMGVAVSPTGNHIAGSASGSPDMVKVFDQGDTTAKRSTTLSGAYSLNHNSIQYSADGNSIYVVSNDGAHTFIQVVPGLPGAPGTLTIKSSSATVTAGKSVTITAHLGTASANKTVSIYRTPIGGSATLVRTAVAGSLGNVAVAVKPGVHTSYYAVWEGDATHSTTTSATITVHVRVAMHAAAQSGYRTLRGYRLYHYNARCPSAAHVGCPSFLLYATPLHPGANLTYVVQAFYRGAWHTVLSGSHVTTTGRLVLKVIYPNRSYVGINQRVHVSMPGDADHLGATSAWTSFRITS
jgi:hypothetical protein